MELSERKEKILRAIIDDYIMTAEPVGSAYILSSHNLGVSSATVRNDMAALEEAGYLEKPHTSAGRVPSDKGYRLYVDMLMEEKEQELHVRYVPLDELMQISDVISIHVPLTDDTRGLISADRIAMMKSTAIIINTARGFIIDQEALVNALKEKKIRGAGLDAFEEEPLSADSPLLELDNLVLTCHHAGSVIDNVLPRAIHAYGNIEKFSRGEAIDPRDIIVKKR